MEQITSPIKITERQIENHNFNLDYFKDQNTDFYDDELHPYISNVKTRYNPNFWCYNADNIIGISLRHYGEYTENEIQLLNMIMQPGWISYDIGANIGYHTLGLAQRSKHVYAFEPNEHNYRLLEHNTRYINNITLFDYAVSDDIGMTHIETFKLTDVGNYGECRIADKGQLASMTTIDHLVKTKQIEPPNLVKIDVEGHEWHVIQGMDDTIKNNLPVIFYENMHGNDLGKIYDYLSGLGYEIFWFVCMNYNPNNYYNNKNNIFANGGVCNAIAFPFYLQIKTNLLKMISNDDTYDKAILRYQEQNAKQD